MATMTAMVTINKLPLVQKRKEKKRERNQRKHTLHQASKR